jgi:hypothetical protein
MFDARLALIGPARTIAILAIATAWLLIAAPAAIAQTTSVSLSAAYNVTGAVTDGSTFTGGGLDGGGAACSATQLGTSRTIGGVPFAFGPANGMNAVRNRTITLPAGAYSKIGILALAVNGNQPTQVFRVGYADASSTSFTQSVSDWFSPQAYAGETVALAMTRRNNADGSADARTFSLYAYAFTLDPGKTAATFTLPVSNNVVVLAATLTNAAPGTPLVRVFQHCDFGGWAAAFTATGSYATSALTSRGGLDNDASSIQVASGYKATLYDGNNQTGSSVVITAGQTACLVANGFNDVLSSLKIEADSTPPPPPPGDVDDTVVSCGSAPGGSGSGDVPYVRVHLKQGVLKVCVEQSFWNAGSNAAAIRRFFNFFDGIVPELTGLFSFTPGGGPFLVQITSPTGGACACVDPKLGASTGVTVTGDAYPNGYTSETGISVPGFWGYLLTLHEFINVWTGEMTSGWPTDWWADHRSPFPNAMDEEVFRDLGARQGNPVLTNAATAQHERYTMSERDPEVLMFLSFFDRFGGFPAYNRVFSLVRADGVHWDSLGVSNPSPLRSEYVMAYLQLGFRTATDLTQSDFVASGVSHATSQDAAYVVSAANVGDIADAHCSIASARASGTNVTSALQKLRSGDFRGAKVANAPCGTCPSECACSPTNTCVAPWRGH